MPSYVVHKTKHDDKNVFTVYETDDETDIETPIYEARDGREAYRETERLNAIADRGE